MLLVLIYVKKEKKVLSLFFFLVGLSKLFPKASNMG